MSQNLCWVQDAGLERTDTGHDLSSEFCRENKYWTHDYIDYKMIHSKLYTNCV